MSRNYKALQALDITSQELEIWASSHETDTVVALAIHAIADDSRNPDAIWEDPTPAEWDHALMAVQEYVANGDYPEQDEYHWGEESFRLED